MVNDTAPLDIKMDENSTQSVVKPIEEERPMNKLLVSIILITSIILGIFTGKILYQKKSSNTQFLTSSGAESGQQKAGGKAVIVGSTDMKTFKDCASGQLVKNDGKLTTEGSHKLLREGGESQSVYLTSSVVDLDQFLSKKVQVCGQTNQAQKAGWLMDVGRVIVQ